MTGGAIKVAISPGETRSFLSWYFLRGWRGTSTIFAIFEVSGGTFFRRD